MKNVLILSGSPRKGGNSDLLCDEFMRGAKEAGNNVTKINVASKKIAPCHACYFCREHGGECAYKDDMAEILQAMIDADVLVLASPVYFYSIDAQLKAVIDRTVARWLEVKDKEFYYIMTAADEDKVAVFRVEFCTDRDVHDIRLHAAPLQPPLHAKDVAAVAVEVQHVGV